MRALLALSLLGLVACGPSPSADDDDTAPDASSSRPDAWGPVELVDAAPDEPCDTMDILFVIDNSGSMQQEQTNLGENFPRFIEVLDGFDQDLDYRVGITSTGRDYDWTMEMFGGITIPESQDGGDNGALLQRCDMTQPWIEDTDPDRVATFDCAAELGDSGPSKEMPLSVVKMAFSDRISDGTNVGFLRDNALLGIVILTDEDDCSYEESVTLGIGESLCDDKMQPVAEYVDFLDNLTGARGRWAVAVIAGATDCESVFGGAEEAVRLKEFINLAGDNAVLSSICEADLSVGLEDALNTFDTACDNFPPID